MYHCVAEGDINQSVDHIRTKQQCVDAKLKWSNQRYNFDNLGQALLSLFVLATKDGWVSLMYQGIDAVGVDQQVC